METKIRSYIRDWKNIPYDFHHILSKFKTLLGRCGFKDTSKYHEHPAVYIHVITGANLMLGRTVMVEDTNKGKYYAKKYHFKDGGKSVELVVRSTMTQDELFMALSKFMDDCGMKRLFRYSVNSTNYMVSKSISNFCEKHNLNPRDEDFLTRYYESKGDKLTHNQKMMKLCIHDIFGDNINSKEATAIWVRLMIANPQAKFTTRSYSRYPISKHTDPYTISKDINLESSYRHLNGVLELMKLPKFKKSEFKFNLPEKFKYKKDGYKQNSHES